MKSVWPLKKIGEVCDLMTGGTPPRSKPKYFGGEIKWLVSGDIHKGEIHDCEGRISTAGLQNSNAKYLPINSVMIALNGQGKTRGTVAMLRTKATCNQSLVSIMPKDPNQLVPEFVYTNLHGRYEEIRRITGDDGNDRRGLNMPLIRDIEIPIPPVNIQKEIVQILDQAFEGIDQAVANTEKNLANAGELFDGYLEREAGNKEALGSFVDIKTGKLNANAAVEDGEYPFFTCSREVSRIDNFAFDCEAILLAGNNASGDFNVKHYKGKFNAYQRTYVLTMRTSSDLECRFLYFQLLKSLKELKQSAVGAGTKFLKLGMIKSLKVSVPPIHKQRQILKELEAIQSSSQRLSSRYTTKLALLSTLRKSLLNKAFAGELTGSLPGRIKEEAVA